MSNLPSQFITGNPTFDSRHSDILNLIRNTGSYTYQAPSQTTVTKNDQAGSIEVDIEGLSPTKPKFDYISKIENDQIPFVAMANIPSIFGKFEVYGFLEKSVNKEHLAIKCGDVDPYKCNVRIHSECWTGDVLGSMKCDCRDQLEAALKFIAQNGGIVLYLRQEGRGIGLLNKLKAYALQEQGYDTVEANIKLGFEDDLRTYESAVEMLKFFGIKRISLLTNNPKKINAIAAAGIEVDRQAHQLEANQYNINYLKTKAKKSGHILEFDKDAKQAEKNKPNVNTNPTTVLGNRITFVETENQKLRSEIERLASENEALKKNGTYLYSTVSSNQTVDTLKQNIAYITAENDRVAKLYHEKTAEIDALKKRVAELETRGSVPTNGLYYPYSYGGYNPYYAPYYSGLYKGI